MPVIRRVVDALDDLPVMPAHLARRALDRLGDRRQARAMGDARYAAIEARRRNDDGTSTMLSDELSLADWDEQDAIAMRLTPEPRWAPLARRVSHWNLADAFGLVGHTVARVRHGWAPSDTWNLGRHLARTTAEMLEYAADHATGWPESDEFPTPESWGATLRNVASELRRMDDDPAVIAALSEWYALAAARETDPADERAASDRLRAAEEARDAAVVAAMAWVAEHIHQLWAPRVIEWT